MIRFALSFALACSVVVLIRPVAAQKPEGEPVPGKSTAGPQRSFRFTYTGKLTGLPQGKRAKVWLPLPQTTSEQEIVRLKNEVAGNASISSDKEYGNRILFFETASNAQGEVPFELAFQVTRREVKTDVRANLTVKPVEDQRLVARYLQPDYKVPTKGKPLELIGARKLPTDQFAAARILYDIVNDHMKYSKEGTGWGQGDALWACDSKFGNCSDFHSLFISMARGNKIPSKFEMGFPIPAQRGEGTVGGYHCWAWFMPQGKGWVPVDISEANRFPNLKEYYFGNLSADRVQFTTGRDINLEPRQAGPPRNFFIYPYAEVDGQEYPAERIVRQFSYKDL